MKSLLTNFVIFISLISLISLKLNAKKLEALYEIKLGALKIGNLEWVVVLEKDKYNTSISINNAGAFSGFYKFSGEYFSKGIFVNDEFIPDKYIQFWKTIVSCLHCQLRIFFK